MTILHRKPFHVMRHGQTHDNAAGLISGGGRDPHLTDLGREQANLAAKAFLTLDPAPTRIITSSLIRTHQTAALVAPHISYEIEARFNERYLGELDGRISEAEQKRLGVLPDEEATATQYSRVLEALNHYLAHDALTLIVSHGGTIRRILEATNLQGRVEVHNAVIYSFLPDGQKEWRVMPAIPV